MIQQKKYCPAIYSSLAFSAWDFQELRSETRCFRVFGTIPFQFLQWAHAPTSSPSTAQTSHHPHRKCLSHDHGRRVSTMKIKTMGFCTALCDIGWWLLPGTLTATLSDTVFNHMVTNQALWPLLYQTQLTSKRAKLVEEDRRMQIAQLTYLELTVWTTL